MKPKIWWNYCISKEEKKHYFTIFNEKYNIDSLTFYNYSYLDVIDGEVYLFIYKDNNVSIHII